MAMAVNTSQKYERTFTNCPALNSLIQYPPSSREDSHRPDCLEHKKEDHEMCGDTGIFRGEGGGTKSMTS